MEYEKQYLREIQDKHLHHEEGLAAQKTFKRQVLDLVQAVNEFGNPFLENSPELLTLDTRNVMDESVIETVCTVESLGKEQYDKYCESVILKCERSIHETISKNNLALFKLPKPKAKSKQAKAVAVLKDDVDFPDCLLWQKTEYVTCPPSLGMKISPFLLPYLNLVQM